MAKNDKPDIILGLAYDRAVKQARTFFILFLGSMALNAILGGAILTMLPLKEIKPYFMPISKAEDHYYKIIPANNLSQTQLFELTRDYLKRYVIDRHTVDNVTEIIRFKRVKGQSETDVFSQVKKEYHKFQERLPNVKRDIEIISDIALEPFYHQIEFKTLDITPDDKVYEKYWVVNIRYKLAGFNAPEIKISAEEIQDNPNPLGLLITNYAWTERKNVKKEAKNEEL